MWLPARPSPLGSTTGGGKSENTSKSVEYIATNRAALELNNHPINVDGLKSEGERGREGLKGESTQNEAKKRKSTTDERH